MGSNSVTLAAARMSHSHRGACLPALSCVCTPVTVQINTSDSCALSSVTVKGKTDLKQWLRMKRQSRKHCNWWWRENRTTEGWKYNIHQDYKYWIVSVEARFAVDDISFLCNDGTAADFETWLTVSVNQKLLHFFALSVSFDVIFSISFLLKSGAEIRFQIKNMMIM